MSSPFLLALAHPLKNFFLDFCDKVPGTCQGGESCSSTPLIYVGKSMKQNYQEDFLQFSLASLTKRHLNSFGGVVMSLW